MKSHLKFYMKDFPFPSLIKLKMISTKFVVICYDDMSRIWAKFIYCILKFH